MYLKSNYVEEVLPYASPQLFLSIPVIVSKAVYTSLDLGFRFKGWIYGTTTVTFALEYLLQSFNPNFTASHDTGCRVTLVDRHWLLKHLSDQKIDTMSIPLKVRGIGVSKHKSSEFAVLLWYFSSQNNIRDLIYILLQCETHFVHGLYANLLISNNIISPEAMVINFVKKIMHIGTCRVIIDMNAKQ